MPPYESGATLLSRSILLPPSTYDNTASIEFIPRASIIYRSFEIYPINIIKRSSYYSIYEQVPANYELLLLASCKIGLFYCDHSVIIASSFVISP